jgi:hypothetical protein
MRVLYSKPLHVYVVVLIIKTTTMQNLNVDFEAITLRQALSHRGGGIEISLDTLGYEGEKMTAYQNYLGGGMLGRICNDCTIRNWREDEKLVAIADQLKRYMHDLTNHEDDEWENQSFEQNQNMPVSADIKVN